MEFLFFYLGYGDIKHKSYKNLCLHLSMVVWFLRFSFKKKQKWEEEWYQERKKAYEGLKPWSLLIFMLVVLHMNPLAPKQIS
jgi:hypothetical protein